MQPTVTADLSLRPADVERPLLSYRDEATGERVDLTAQQVGSWAARSASLLRDGCGLGPGSRVAVLLPPHWRTAAVLLGAWASGLAVSFRPRAPAGLPVLEPG
ncbi:AMP-binding protein, partial [Micromonospora sp. M51]|uniref:TIGR03089 family protein n=1 Tax=Micromonospora sp. M51 TaxID=2824889 RepID=UPI001B391315